VACGDAALQGRVARGLVGMGAQEIAEGDVAELVLASGRADVQVIPPRPLRRLGEEVVVGRFGRRDEQYPSRSSGRTYRCRGSIASTES
jgi:hypothetical protein